MIYFDNAATTAVKKEVLEAMVPYFCEKYGNPSTIYSIGQEAKEALDAARADIAECLNCTAKEIYFTASGTEADNWALRSTVQNYSKKGNKIIVSAIEHHAVLKTAESLEKQGYEVVYLPCDEYGIISPETLEKAMDDKTVLVSIMYVNNEIGTIEPIKELAKVAHKYGAIFHTDAVQAAGNMPIDVQDLGVDMLSISGHKFHAPKGVGALYVKKGIKTSAFITGGHQENGKRGGTENVPYIVGMAKALKMATESLDEKTKKVTYLRDKLIKGIEEKIPYARLNGHPTLRAAGNVNFSFRFIEGEGMLLWLEMNGIAASSGSACTSGSLDPSHVLLAIGLPHEIAHGSLRISIGDTNTEEEVDILLETLPGIVEKLRNMSPLYEEFIKGEN